MLALNQFLMVLLVVFMWGFNNILIKLGLYDLPPLFMTCMRFIVVSAILLPFHYKITRKQLLYFLPLSITFGVMHFSCLFFGIKYTDSGTGAILIQIGTPLSMLLAAFFFREKLNIIQIIGIFISLLGVFILTKSPTIPDWKGVYLLMTSALGWAISNIIIKKIKEISQFTIISWVSFLSIPVVGLISFLLEEKQIHMLLHASWRGWFAILYSAIGSSIFAYSLWYKLIRKNDMNIIMPYSLLTPIFSVIMGTILLHDPINIFKIIGAFFIISGVAFSSIKLKNNL